MPDRARNHWFIPILRKASGGEASAYTHLIKCRAAGQNCPAALPLFIHGDEAEHKTNFRNECLSESSLLLINREQLSIILFPVPVDPFLPIAPCLQKPLEPVPVPFLQRVPVFFQVPDDTVELIEQRLPVAEE